MTISSDSKELLYLVMSLDFAVYFHPQNTTLLLDEKRSSSSFSQQNLVLSREWKGLKTEQQSTHEDRSPVCL